jgi:hypothetical protein
MSSSYTIKLSGFSDTHFDHSVKEIGHSVKEIVEFWPEQFKNNEGNEILTSIDQRFWLEFGIKVFLEQENTEIRGNLVFESLSGFDSFKELNKWAACTKFCWIYVESWAKFALSELTLWKAIFKLKELHPLLEGLKQKDYTHFDLWIKTQKEWKLQDFVDACQSTGQADLLHRWRILKKAMNNEKNPFKSNNSQEGFRRLLISLVLEARKHLLPSDDFCKIWRGYQAEYANYLRMLRNGIEYEGEKNIKKQTLKIQGNKIVGLSRNPNGGIPLDPIKYFKSGRGPKAKKSK